MTEPIDIVMLTHNRLEHLVRAVDALETHTPEPYRLTIVDNASGPEVRNWLAANRHRFAQLILRPTNEHVPAFQHGIAATASDPFVLTDPDVVVPALQPSWLARMLDLLERHPDFGLIGLGCDPSNRPPASILEPEVIDPATLVDDEIVETSVGTVFQFIRRDALVAGYHSDAQACATVRHNGYRVGWSPLIRGLHLGWDDFRLYPGHLLGKRESEVRCYPESYAETDLVARPATLEQIALAAPVLARCRGLGIEDAGIVELAWGVPALGAVARECVSVEGGDLRGVARAEAIVLMLPPAEQAAGLIEEATRIAARLVVAVAPLSAFVGRTAADLAPGDWQGSEAPAVGDLPMKLLRAADADPALRLEIERSVAGHGDRWTDWLSAATIGESTLRLFIFESRAAAGEPARVQYDPSIVRRRRPGTMTRPVVPSRGWVRRLRRRADLRGRSTVWLGRVKRRIDPM